MGALTRRDVLFLVWNAAVGLVVGALTVRWAELASAPVPPVLWLVVGMAAFEIGGAVLLAEGAARHLRHAHHCPGDLVRHLRARLGRVRHSLTASGTEPAP